MTEVLDEDEKIAQGRKMYAYDITQKLTYFVVTAELALCGYMLLNVDKLSSIRGFPYIFLLCGLAAFMGLLWRFCYNITFHSYAHAHNRKNGKLELDSKQFDNFSYKMADRYQGLTHNTYAILSIVCFLWILGAGFWYLLSQV